MRRSVISAICLRRSATDGYLSTVIGGSLSLVVRNTSIGLSAG